MKKIAIALCLIAALAAGYFIFRSNKAPSLSASYSNGVLYYSVANRDPVRSEMAEGKRRV